MVNSFTCLGLVVSNDGDIFEDIKMGLAKASRVLGACDIQYLLTQVYH